MSEDASSFAARVADELAPALPLLLHDGGGASSLARALWHSLQAPVSSNPAAQQTVAQVADDPDAPGAKAALAFQLRALFKSNPSLSQELAQLLRAAEGSTSSTTVTAAGARSVAIGGNVSGTHIITGDSNRFENTTTSGVDPLALVAALADLQAALGQANLPAGDRMIAQTAAGNAALEGVQDGQIKSEVVAQNVERIGATLKNANTAIQEGSSLWSSVQTIATTLGPLVGGARIVAAWFGVPLPI